MSTEIVERKKKTINIHVRSMDRIIMLFYCNRNFAFLVMDQDNLLYSFAGKAIPKNTSTQKWAIVFYRILMPCVGSRRKTILKWHYKKLSNTYTTSQEGYILLELKNNWEIWTHLARYFFDKADHFDEEREKSILSTLYTNSRFLFKYGWLVKGRND